MLPDTQQVVCYIHTGRQSGGVGDYGVPESVKSKFDRNILNVRPHTGLGLRCFGCLVFAHCVSF